MNNLSQRRNEDCDEIASKEVRDSIDCNENNVSNYQNTSVNNKNSIVIDIDEWDFGSNKDDDVNHNTGNKNGGDRRDEKDMSIVSYANMVKKD
ncbi:hypothetical protein Tco_0367574 [Tanacetum coccineum]